MKILTRICFSLLTCALLLLSVLPVLAQGSDNCTRRLGGIGAICNVPGAIGTIEIWGVGPASTGGSLLRLTQAQVDAAQPGALVASSADGRIAVRLELDRNITIAMGPGPEGKVHHVTLHQSVDGNIIATADTYGGPPGAIVPAVPVVAAIPASQGVPVPVYQSRPRSDGSVIHIVRPGHTLNRIAQVYSVDPQDLIERNTLRGTGSLLYVGQVLVIQDAPLPETIRPDECGPELYVVQRGDTLYSIARAFRIRRHYLYVRNQLTRRGSLIYPGQELVIPGLSLPADGDADAGCEVEEPLYHTVRSGHTLHVIALVYGVNAQDLIELNQLSGGGRWIFPGQELLIRDEMPLDEDDDVVMDATDDDDADDDVDADDDEEEDDDRDEDDADDDGE